MLVPNESGRVALVKETRLLLGRALFEEIIGISSVISK